MTAPDHLWLAAQIALGVLAVVIGGIVVAAFAIGAARDLEARRRNRRNP